MPPAAVSGNSHESLPKGVASPGSHRDEVGEGIGNDSSDEVLYGIVHAFRLSYAAVAWNSTTPNLPEE